MTRPARFFRCDLQVQTPWDRDHWGGEDVSSMDDQQIAKEIVDAAYERNLDVIAITDHNFASKNQIPIVQEAARAAKPEGREPLVVLPGFEISVSVGKHWHALAIFDEDADLDAIDKILHLCGVPVEKKGPSGWEPARESFAEILDAVQGNNGPAGIVIPAHATADDGIFDGDKIADWFQRDVFRDSDLLCVDLNRDPNQLSKGWVNLFGNGEECSPEWKRPRKIALCASSDARAFRQPSDGKRNAEAAWIGKRSTWIKMSHPCIEALRSAFLDPDDRVIHQDDSPNVPAHPWIHKVTLRGGAHFAETEELELSPFLNTIIGGRGSGKSSLLGATACVASGTYTDRYRGAWEASGVVSARWRQGETAFETEFDSQNNDGTENAPPGARVVTQGQIVDMGSAPQAFVGVLDELCGAKLKDRERSTRELQTDASRLQGVRQERAAVSAQLADTQQQLTAAERDLASNQKAHEAATKARRQREIGILKATAAQALEFTQGQLWNTAQEVGARLDAASAVADGLELDETAESKSLEWIGRVRDLIADTLSEAIVAVDALSTDAFIPPSALSEADPVDTQIDLNFDGHPAAIAAETTEARRQAFETQVADLEKQGSTLDADLSKLFGTPDESGLYLRLQQAWRHETAARTDVLPSESLTSSSGERIELRLLPYATPSVASATFADLLGHRGRFNGSDLADVFGAAYNEASAESFAFAPAALVAAWASPALGSKAHLVLGRDLPRSLEDATTLTPARRDAFREVFGTPEALHTLLSRRVPDALDADLKRQDGTSAGTILGEQLSEGQRAAVVLSLLLLSEGPPLLLDQPEDDLDNRFIISHLVAGLRGVKRKRQVIVISHNPNIPVLGGSEQVISCTMTTGKAVGTPLGAIDRADCKTAVHDILEGSAQAFRRRMEIYGF